MDHRRLVILILLVVITATFSTILTYTFFPKIIETKIETEKNQIRFYANNQYWIFYDNNTYQNSLDNVTWSPLATIMSIENQPHSVSYLTYFDIRNVRYMACDFGKNRYFEFVDGKFDLCDMDWRGYWTSKVMLRNTVIKNCTFELTNLTIELENCQVENGHFFGTFDSAVHLNSTTFTGTTVFDVPVVNKGNNQGLENVIFNDRVFDWED